MEPENEVSLNSCPICLQSISDNDLCITNCEHSFCKSCMRRFLHSNNIIICPICRADIKEYVNNESTHYIVKVIVNNNNNQATNNNMLNIIRELRQKNAYFKLIIFLNLLYLIYSFYHFNEITSEIFYYRKLYNNCTDELEILNEDEQKLINYINDVGWTSDSRLNPINVYLNSNIYQCYFPIYYINKCLSTLI